MSQIIALIYICIVLISMIQLYTCAPPTPIELFNFVKKLGEQAKDTLDFINEGLAKSKNLEVVQNLNPNSIDSFSQSAQVMKLNGIKDEAFPHFIERFISNLKLPEQHKKNVTDALINITQIKSNDWEQYKFIYTKNEGNNTCYFVSILANHDRFNNKSNFIYSNIKTSLNKTNIMVLIKTERKGFVVEDEVEIINKPQELHELDLELVIKYYDVVAVKAFGSYLGVTNKSKELAYENKLLFLQDA